METNSITNTAKIGSYGKKEIPTQGGAGTTQQPVRKRAAEDKAEDKIDSNNAGTSEEETPTTHPDFSIGFSG